MINVEGLTITQINFVNELDNLLLKLCYYLSDLDFKMAIKTFIYLVPFEVRFLFYDNLSFLLTNEYKHDIILVLKTKINKMEAL